MRKWLSQKFFRQGQAILNPLKKHLRQKSWSQRRVLALGTLVLLSSMSFAPPAQAASLMQMGSSGPAVRTLQTELANLGYSVGPEDGIFGLQTLSAVEAFQRTDHLQVDGIAGPLTESALEHTGGIKAAQTAPSLTVAKPAPVVPKPAPVVPSALAGKASAGTVGTSVTLTKVSGLVTEANKFMGVPYVWGGTTPSGFDCSGYTQYVFASQGIALPRTSLEQAAVGTPVAYASLRAGDLVFFSFSGSGVIDHVGIYLGNSQFISATTHKGVAIYSFSPYWLNAYKGARSVL